MTTLADDGRTQVDKTSRTVRTWLCVVRVEIYHTLCTVDAVLAEPNPREGRGEGRRLNATSLAWTVVIYRSIPADKRVLRIVLLQKVIMLLFSERLYCMLFPLAYNKVIFS